MATEVTRITLTFDPAVAEVLGSALAGAEGQEVSFAGQPAVVEEVARLDGGQVLVWLAVRGGVPGLATGAEGVNTTGE